MIVVPLNTIATFTRMKQLSEDIELVKEAVKASSIVQLNADGTMLKRIAALPDEDTSNPRTIYAVRLDIIFTYINRIIFRKVSLTKLDTQSKM